MTITELSNNLQGLMNANSEISIEEEYSIQSSPEDSYIADLAILKNGDPIIVVKDVTNADVGRIQADLFNNCPDVHKYVLLDGNNLTLKERPSIHRVEPQSFYNADYITSDDLVHDVGRTISIQELANEAVNYNATHFLRIDSETLFAKLRENAIENGLAHKIENFIYEVGTNEIMEFNNTDFWLHWQYEDKLMQYILGDVNPDKPLYRYTSKDNFMRILSEGTHSMCSLACMNDPSEMDYAQCYFRKKNVNNVKALGNVEQSVDAFITSLTIQNDDLTMWRFYGDDARGVSIEYDAYIVNQDNSPFLISPVSYSNEDGCHPELDYIGNLLNEIIDGRRFHLKRWDLWQHFFKSHEYAIEREVRLLMRCDIFDSETFYNIKRQWITTSDEITAPIIILPFKSGNAENEIIFPLKLKGVLLGPKFPRKETNCLTLNMLVNEKEFFDQNLYVNISKISNYR